MRITIKMVLLSLGVITLSGCATQYQGQSNRQNCVSLGHVSNPIELRTLFDKYKEPLVLVDGESPYFCGCGSRKIGGAMERRNLGGAIESRRLGGTTEFRWIGGVEEFRKLSGSIETRKLEGGIEERKVEGVTQNLSCQIVSSCNLYKVANTMGKIQLFDGVVAQPVQANGCVDLLATAK